MKTTSVEEIHEPIDALTIFRDGAVRPVKFKWAGKTYTISRVTYEWISREGSYPVYHFAVTADQSDDIYEIELNTFSMSWTLAKVHMK